MHVRRRCFRCSQVRIGTPFSTGSETQRSLKPAPGASPSLSRCWPEVRPSIPRLHDQLSRGVTVTQNVPQPARGSISGPALGLGLTPANADRSTCPQARSAYGHPGFSTQDDFRSSVSRSGLGKSFLAVRSAPLPDLAYTMSGGRWLSLSPDATPAGQHRNAKSPRAVSGVLAWKLRI